MAEEKVYPQRKIDFVAKLKEVVAGHKTCLLATADFVGSKQLQQIRKALRGHAVVVMGKKTMMRNVLRAMSEVKPELERLIPLVRGNVGLVWTNDDPAGVRDIVVANKVPAAAKVGQIAPLDVFVPPGATPLDPGQTSFFQALNIATKISRGAIEILNEVHLIKKDEKCGNSEVALLNKLNLKPFSFGMRVITVFDDGQVYGENILNMNDAALLASFSQCASTVAALSLAIGYPTAASIPHTFSNAFRKLVALSMVSEYSFEEATKFKSGMSAAPAGAAAAATSAAPAAPAAAAAKPVEAEPEEDVGVGGIFD